MNASNWQIELSTIRERNEYAFKKSLFCDVEFSVQDSNGVKVTVPANKYVLAISSPVFEAMFYGQFAESHTPTIKLPDCTKEGLQEMLRYVYTDEVNLTESEVMQVLYLAEKYMMPFLVEKCKNYLKDKVGPDDVFSILPQVEKIHDEKLQKHLWDIVDRETHKVVSSMSFLNVTREMLCEILVRDTLNIKELDLFRAVDRWAEERIKEQNLESNGETKRSILGEEIIKMIRFPLMMEKEFTEVVLPSKILKMHDVVELVQTFHNVLPATSVFSKKKRYLNSVLIPRVRFNNIRSGQLYLDGDNPPRPHSHCIAFKVNQPLFLVGVRMFGSRGSKYNIFLYIMERKLPISQLCSLFSTESDKIDDLYYGFTVNLEEPVRLLPGVLYTMVAIITGPPSDCGDLGDRVVVVENNTTITYENSKLGGLNTTVTSGQFPTLIFKRIDDGQG